MCVCPSCVSTEPDHGGVCTYVLCLNTGNEPIMHARFGKHTRSVMVRIEYTGVSCENVWNHCVYTSSSTPIARANACTHARRMDAMGLMRAFVCRRRARRRTRETREPRRSTSIASNVSLLPVSLASRSIDSTDEFIAFHSFIHSVATEGTREGTTRGTRPTRDATDERREILDDRRVRSHRARRERYARLERTTRRIAHSLRARILNHPPETIERLNAMKRAKRSSD